MGSKPMRGITRHNTGKLFLLSMRLSGELNSGFRNSVIGHTWPHNHVLEYRPLETFQHLKRTPSRVSYLDRIHEVRLELTGESTMT